MLRRESLLKNKKGDFAGLIYFIISIAVLGIVLLVGGYISVEVSTQLKDKINSSVDEVNNAFDTTKNVAERTLPAVWYFLFTSLALGLFVTSWYMRTNPIFVPMFIILLVVAVIVGIAMSNAYEKINEVTEFNSIANSQDAINFVMCKLPWVAFIVGVISLVITFAKSPGGSQGFTTPPM